MEKKIFYKNKYKIKSTRWDGYDYSQSGFYFVTFCTKNRKRYFGNIINGKMILNNLGKLALKYWLEIPKHFPYAELDEFIIMPNHIHGIIFINNKQSVNTPKLGVLNSQPNPAHPVETPKLGVLNSQPNPAHPVNMPKLGVLNSQPNPAHPVETPKLGVSTGGHKLQWKSGVLGVIINQYKRKCTITIRQKNNLNFSWQPKFHDRVIRNNRELCQIRQYIINNPIKWEFDRNNSDNLK
ncbi:MAG: transposase [Patescibacteria group bacterium]|nr:transposase [Patescibacteria group bacterium]